MLQILLQSISKIESFCRGSDEYSRLQSVQDTPTQKPGEERSLRVRRQCVARRF
jgi:hypothetical protein